jgi:hypothetical protein
VLSGDGTAGQQLLALWARVQRKVLSARAELRVESPVDAKVSIGADPVVLRDGKRALPWSDPNIANYRQPHTLVGWNKAGETFLVAVDGRQQASAGLNLAQAADFLVSLGVTDAVNLDGGGGTVFTAGGVVWNRPSDNQPSDPTRYIERGAVNAFAVMARGGAPLPPPSPPPPVAVSTVPPGPGPGPGTLPHPGTTPGPSAPTASVPAPFGGPPAGGVGGQVNAGDPPLADAAAQPGATPLQARRLTLDGVAPEAVPAADAAPVDDSSGSGDEEGHAIVRATLSAASAAVGDVVSPMNGPLWRPRSLADMALGSAIALAVVGWSQRRPRRARRPLPG